MTVPSSLTDAPPSVKLAYSELAHHEPLSYSALRTETELPDSTLDFALSELKRRGCVSVQDDEYRCARRNPNIRG